jgi:hypothetical protein
MEEVLDYTQATEVPGYKQAKVGPSLSLELIGNSCLPFTNLSPTIKKNTSRIRKGLRKSWTVEKRLFKLILVNISIVVFVSSSKDSLNPLLRNSVEQALDNFSKLL